MVAAQSKLSPIHFKAKLVTIGSWTILRLPESESAKLPSRGQTMVEGTINGVRFRIPLEPDGKWSHWFIVDSALGKAANISSGDIATLEIQSTDIWPEPNIPDDLKRALKKQPQALSLWQDITPMARWEWIRWIRSTGNTETRARRVEVACSKLKSGKRRPCCWNRNLCSEPSVSKNGVLIEST